MRLALATTLLIGWLPLTARSQDVDLHGYVDFRAVLAPEETAWIDGGLGKTRYGDDGLKLRAAAAVLAATWHASPAVIAVADAQWQAGVDPHVDLLDAYFRYRPVSLSAWRWSAKLGAFFAPISLENDGIGWTSPWTLTPSAINSWIGEELRTVGAEVQLERRSSAGTFTASAAALIKNDPAGELLAARGWSLSDLSSGIGARLREPDAFAAAAFSSVPIGYRPFDEIDHRLGWYAGVSFLSPAYGQLRLLRYDNRADPTRSEPYGDRNVFGWHTRFWSFGAQSRFSDLVLIAQAIDGSTAFEPLPDLYLDTRFHSAFLLAGWDRSALKPSLRVDFFQTRQLPDSLPAALSEHGSALTFALNWRPRPWLRLTGELLRVDSVRSQRARTGEDAHQIDAQAQIGARILF